MLVVFAVKPRPSVHVRSIQWLGKNRYKTGFLSSLVILYEAHQFMARSCGFLLDKWLGARFLGLTATPCRLDGRPFTDFFKGPCRLWGLESLKDGVFPLYDYIVARKGSRFDYLLKSLESAANYRLLGQQDGECPK